MPGIVIEGDGEDSDGDGLIDDNGDFNGDGLLAYDPEWHVSEDLRETPADGYPESAEISDSGIRIMSW